MIYIDPPPYKLVPASPLGDRPFGCGGCAFRKMLNVRCTPIPCQYSTARGGPFIAVLTVEKS